MNILVRFATAFIYVEAPHLPPISGREVRYVAHTMAARYLELTGHPMLNCVLPLHPYGNFRELAYPFDSATTFNDILAVIASYDKG